MVTLDRVPVSLAGMRADAWARVIQGVVQKCRKSEKKSREKVGLVSIAIKSV